MQVSIIMSEGTCKTRMKASDFRFTKVKGWLGSDQTERIEGWKTYIYEAAGKMKAGEYCEGEQQQASLLLLQRLL